MEEWPIKNTSQEFEKIGKGLISTILFIFTSWANYLIFVNPGFLIYETRTITISEGCFEFLSITQAFIINVKYSNSTKHPVSAQKNIHFLTPTSVGYLVMLNKC